MLETKVIPIEYDEETKQQAEELKTIIENNPMLFQMFLAGHKKISFLENIDDETLGIDSIDDLKSLLETVIPAYMEILKKQVYTEGGKEFDSNLLRMMLQDIIASRDNSELQASPEIRENINTIYTVVASTYYENETDVINFIFNPTGEEKEKIFTYLNKKERYNLLNLLLEEEYQNLLELEAVEHDNYLRTHLEELLELSEIDIVDRFTKREKRTDLPNLSEEELDKLCIEFLIQIDPSLKWLKIYNDFKKNNNILYYEEFPDTCSKWGCVETTDNVYIYAPLEGNISDFMYFIHEFAHAITLINKEKGECIPSSIQEFPSIFFERCATAFLREKGYREEDVTDLEEERLISTLGNKSDISPSLRYLIDYLTKGPITFEQEKEKMDRIRAAIPDDLPEEMIELLNMLMSTQDEENIHVKIDAENAFLIEHPNCIFEEYPYILGNELADATLFKVKKDPMLIYTMLSLTENLTKETYASVCNKLGFGTSSKENKQYIKQKNEN